MSKIPEKFLDAVRDGREFPVLFRWGETFQGQTDWTDWEEGFLIYQEQSNPNNEPGVTIKGELGWGYAGREKDLEKVYGKTIFGRYAEPGSPNEHLVQVKFEED